jgi:hypothetical protein
LIHTIELTDDELRLVQVALHSHLDDFGHEEADVLRQIKNLLAKLPAVGVPGGVTVRLMLWNVGDSMTTLAELRAKLPELPQGDVWISDAATDRFGLISFSGSLRGIGPVRELIGKDPEIGEEFELEH